VANFVKRLKKGTDDRYKGKLPLIYFKCDGIGHFSNKFPHKKKKIHEEDDSNNKQTYKGKITKNKVFKKNFCTKEDLSSSNKDEVSESEIERVIFMEIEEFDKEYIEDEYEESKFECREELLSAIEVIKIENKKNKKLQAELDKKEDIQNSNYEELEQLVTKLKVQIEEYKRNKEALKEHLE
jgi:hypothetical protein